MFAVTDGLQENVTTYDVSREPVRPFLITKDEEGVFRPTIQDTRYNSQGYPIVTSNLLIETFKTVNDVRAFAQENYDAEAGQYARK